MDDNCKKCGRPKPAFPMDLLERPGLCMRMDGDDCLRAQVDALTKDRANVSDLLSKFAARGNEIIDLLTKLEEARATISRQNYRLQLAEAGFAKADKLRRELCTQGRGRTFGRALANWAAAHYKEQRDDAVEYLRTVLEFGECPEPRTEECPPSANCCPACAAYEWLAEFDAQEQVHHSPTENLIPDNESCRLCQYDSGQRTSPSNQCILTDDDFRYADRIPVGCHRRKKS